MRRGDIDLLDVEVFAERSKDDERNGGIPIVDRDKSTIGADARLNKARVSRVVVGQCG